MHRLFSKNFLKNYPHIPYLASEWASAHVAENIVPDWKEFTAILAAYSEDSRHYHTLAHLVHGLKEINRLSKGLNNLHVVKLAFFFHDVVYNVKNTVKGKNEADSAKRFVAYMGRKGFSDRTIRDGERLIIDSASHGTSAARSAIWKVFSDADLAILGTEWSIYLRYAQNIYREFSWVGPEQFVANRLIFLKKTLDTRIFHLTEEMREFEKRAKANIQSEIDTLTNNPTLITG